jgi:hypothetical protein
LDREPATRLLVTLGLTAVVVMLSALGGEWGTAVGQTTPLTPTPIRTAPSPTLQADASPTPAGVAPTPGTSGSPTPPLAIGGAGAFTTPGTGPVVAPPAAQGFRPPPEAAEFRPRVSAPEVRPAEVAQPDLRSAAAVTGGQPTALDPAALQGAPAGISAPGGPAAVAGPDSRANTLGAPATGSLGSGALQPAPASPAEVRVLPADVAPAVGSAAASVPEVVVELPAPRGAPAEATAPGEATLDPGSRANARVAPAAGPFDSPPSLLAPASQVRTPLPEGLAPVGSTEAPILPPQGATAHENQLAWSLLAGLLGVVACCLVALGVWQTRRRRVTPSG